MVGKHVLIDGIRVYAHAVRTIVNRLLPVMSPPVEGGVRIARHEPMVVAINVKFGAKDVDGSVPVCQVHLQG